MRHLLAVLVLSVLTAVPPVPAMASFYDLLNAARANDTELARQLLAEGTEPNGGPSGYPDSYAPLMWAARHGNIELMRLLLAAGAETERRDFNGDRALLWAAQAGQAEAVALLLASGSPPASPDDPYGMTPLMGAAWGGRDDTVEILLRGEADPAARDQSGRTALAYAVLSQHPRSVELLLRAGADASIPDDILHDAAARPEAAIVSLLLAAAADPARPNEAGETALHIAARRGLPENVAALLEAGADPAALDAFGQTPLLAAIAGKPLEFADNDAAAALLAPQAEDIIAPFLAAAAAGMPRTALILLGRGADPNAVNAHGEPVLAPAARLDDPALFEALLAAGADLGRFGDAALVSAASANRVEIAARLIDLGVAVDAERPDGATPLRRAAEAGAVEMVRFLLQRGAAPMPPEQLRLAPPLPETLEEQRSAALDYAKIALRRERDELRGRQLEIRAILAAAL